MHALILCVSMMTEPLRISPRFTVDEWKDLHFLTEEQWQKAIDVFEDRIRGRFLKFIKLIERYTYSGFAVLALDCLLIETLQQFRKGVFETPPRESKEYFVEFLTETSFADFFDSALAEMFYDQIRCGILHQAEIKSSSRVLIRHQALLVSFTDDKEGLVINRKLFHRQLVKEFENYVAQLRKKDPPNKDLRQKFKNKMDYICRISTPE